MHLQCFQNGDDRMKRLVWVDQPSVPDPAARPQTPAPQDSAFAAEAQRLDAEKIEDDSGDDMSVGQIIQRLSQIRDLRASGDISGLGRNILQWYGTRYAALIPGGVVTNTVIDNIRNAELDRVRDLCNAQGRTEFAEIRNRDIDPPPAFNVAITQLTAAGGLLPSNLKQETRDLLNSMNLAVAGQNSATEFLRTSREKAAAETELARLQGELADLNNQVERNNQAKARIDQQKADWDRKKWSLVPKAIEKIAKPVLKIGAAGAGLFGLGKGFATAASTATTSAAGWGMVGESLWGMVLGMKEAVVGMTTFGSAAGLTGVVAGALVYNYLNPNDIRRRARHWWDNERTTTRDIGRQQERIAEQQLVVDQAEKTLEGYRTQNLERVQQLRAKRTEWEKELKNPSISTMQRNDLMNGIARLNAVIMLFRVSEGDFAQSITATGGISNQMIVQNLEALGLREEGESIYPELDQLVERQDVKHTKVHQTSIKKIATEGSVEKEFVRLNAAEQQRVRDFFQDPTNPARVTAVLGVPNLNRNAPRLFAAISSMSVLNDNNVWKVRMARAFLQTMEEKDITMAQASLKAVLSDMEQSNPGTAKEIQRNPQLIVNVAPTLTPPRAVPATAPQPGENLESWMKKLSNTDIALVIAILERIQTHSVNAAGNNLEDRLGVIRTTIAGYHAALSGDAGRLQGLLDTDPAPILSAAAEAFLNKRGVSYDFPDMAGIDFPQAINQITDRKALTEIRQIMSRMNDEAYEKDGGIAFVNKDVEKIDNNLKKIQDEDVRALILARPGVLQTVEPTLPDPAALVPPATNFDSYVTQINAVARATVAEVLLRINNPSDRYILNLAGDNLEREQLQLRNRIENVFRDLDTSIAGGADAVARLNSATVQHVNQALISATRIVFGTPKRFALPHPGRGGNAFMNRVDAMSSPKQLKDLADLMEGIAASCQFDSGSNQFRPA